MKEIKEKIEKLIDQNKLKIKKIGLFTIEFELYDVAKILQNNGLFPQAVIYPFDNKCKKKMGIPVYSLKQFKQVFGSDQSIILIRNIEYKIHKNELLNSGYIINKNLFVDFEKKNASYFFKAKIKSLVQKCIYMPFALQVKYYGLKKYARCIEQQLKGFIVYNKIRNRYFDVPIYVYDYTGIGDVYIFCLYLNGNQNSLAPNGMVLTVIGNASKRVTDLFGIKNVIRLEKSESENLTHFSRLLGKELNIHPMTPFPSHMHTDIYSHYIYGNKLNMAEAYQYVMFELRENNISYPHTKILETDVIELFDKNSLKKGKTVVLSPYANTIIGYSLDFWVYVVVRLKQNGFTICTNCSGREKAIPGTVGLNYPLEMAEQVVNYAGYFLGLRSGFCDIICNSNAFKYIIYPDYPIFNSNVYEFCSFKKMRVGKNIKEICWGYEDLRKLQEKVCKEIISCENKVN